MRPCCAFCIVRASVLLFLFQDVSALKEVIWYLSVYSDVCQCAYLAAQRWDPDQDNWPVVFCPSFASTVHIHRQCRCLTHFLFVPVQRTCDHTFFVYSLVIYTCKQIYNCLHDQNPTLGVIFFYTDLSTFDIFCKDRLLQHPNIGSHK